MLVAGEHKGIHTYPQQEHQFSLHQKSCQPLCPADKPPTPQGCLTDTEMRNRGPLSRVSPHACLPSTSDTQDYLLAAVPSRKTRWLFFFLVGIVESRGRELGRRRGVEGWETHTVRFIFRKQPGWICKSSSCFLKMRFLWGPPLRIPQCPPFSPCPCITSRQGKGPWHGSGHSSLG